KTSERKMVFSCVKHRLTWTRRPKIVVSKRVWLDGARPPDVFGQTVPFGKGRPLGVRKGRICNTALRKHVIVPRNCEK
ncbi:hypothetical protein BGU14_17450, partial [Clostridioides difficile]